MTSNFNVWTVYRTITYITFAGLLLILRSLGSFVSSVLFHVLAHVVATEDI